jgi:hypothetical protein
LAALGKREPEIPADSIGRFWQSARISQTAFTTASHSFGSISKSDYRWLTPELITEIDFIHNNELE